MLLISSGSAQTEKQFTPSQLSKYNGANSAKAYVAVNKVVYDVTTVRSWKGGKHPCPGALAGKDLTSLWNLVPKSHRNPDFLNHFPKVGRLVAEPKTPTPAPLGSRNTAPSQKNRTSNVLTWAGLAALGALAAIWLIWRSRRK